MLHFGFSSFLWSCLSFQSSSELFFFSYILSHARWARWPGRRPLSTLFFGAELFALPRIFYRASGSAVPPAKRFFPTLSPLKDYETVFFSKNPFRPPLLVPRRLSWLNIFLNKVTRGTSLTPPLARATRPVPRKKLQSSPLHPLFFRCLHVFFLPPLPYQTQTFLSLPLPISSEPNMRKSRSLYSEQTQISLRLPFFFHLFPGQRSATPVSTPPSPGSPGRSKTTGCGNPSSLCFFPAFRRSKLRP